MTDRSDEDDKKQGGAPVGGAAPSGKGGVSRRHAAFFSAAAVAFTAASAKAQPAPGGAADAPPPPSMPPGVGAAQAPDAGWVGGPYAGFEGKVERTAVQSQPWWPPENRAPTKAPNIIVFLCDDMGYSDLGAFGSEIETPNLDRMAKEGLRYADYHVEPTCSPTRAALLTGRNPHAVGFGFPTVTGGVDPGFPGYAWQLADDTATAAEIFHDNGYATLAVGKWHLSRMLDIHESSPTTSWPTRRGFDRYYGDWGNPNLHQPEEIWSDNHIVQTDQYPEGYFYLDDLTNNAVSMIHGVRQGDPDKPFFLYFAVPSPHAPLNAMPEDIAKYRGRYDAGWDAMRDARFARQKAMGLVDANTRLPPRNSEVNLDVPAWADLPPDRKELFARYMEIYAGLVDRIDQNFGRLRAALEEMGEWDNTIVIMHTDNGASREGELTGTSQYGQLIMEILTPQGEPHHGEEAVAFDYAAFKAGIIGGPQTQPHYPRGWAMVGNTPFRLYKADTFCGGHQVPMIFSWPAGLKAKGEIRRQYVHVTDVLPTLLDLVGIEPPEVRNGRRMQKISGVSFAKSLRDTSARSDHIEQYTESIGSRRYYRDGWAVVTVHQHNHPFDDTEWQLFNVANDPTEIDNLAARYPQMVTELSQAWERAAWENQVFPMNDGSGVFFMSHAPFEERYSKPLSIFQSSPTVPSWRSRWLTDCRSFVVRTRFSASPGAQGTLFSHGGQGGGYGLFVDQGRLVFIQNGYGRMTEIDCGSVPSGDHEVVVAVDALPGLKWNVTVSLDGRQVGAAQGLPMLSSLAPIGGINVGIDRRSPISWRLYEKYGPFAYKDAIKIVTYEPGPWASDMSPEKMEAIRRAAQQNIL